jgi:hypothetical protein
MESQSVRILQPVKKKSKTNIKKSYGWKKGLRRVNSMHTWLGGRLTPTALCCKVVGGDGSQFSVVRV